MNIKYEAKSDAMYIQFNDRPVDHTIPVNDVIIIDFAADETLVGIELLAVSRYTDNLDAIIAQFSRQATRSS